MRAGLEVVIVADDIARFVTPDRHAGDPVPFEVEVIHITRHTEAPEDAGDDWQPWESEERRTHKFHAVSDLSGGVLVQIDLMIASTRGGSSGAGAHVRGGDALFDFLEAMVVPEDRARFMGLIHDKDVYIHQQLLTNIALHFYQLYSNRPTKPPVS